MSGFACSVTTPKNGANVKVMGSYVHDIEGGHGWMGDPPRDLVGGGPLAHSVFLVSIRIGTAAPALFLRRIALRWRRPAANHVGASA